MNVELLSQQPLPQQQGPGIADYVNVVRRRIWHVVIPFVLFTLIGFGVTMLVPKEYQAVTSLYIDDDYAAGVFSSVGVTIPHKQLLMTVQQDVIRVDFLNPLVEKYGITEGYNPSVPKERAKMYEKIRKRVLAKTVPQKQGPDFIEFYYEGRDPVRVTEFVNAISQNWQADFSRRYGQAAQAIWANIETLHQESLAAYVAASNKLKNFQDANGPDYFGKDPGGLAKGALGQLKTDVDNWGYQLSSDEASLRVVN